MHFGWSLLVLWNARRLAVKICAGVYVGVMTLATVGLGEHYYIDLLIAIPFCWIVQTYVRRILARRLVEVKVTDVDRVDPAREQRSG
jgi:hypothetical protein